MRLTPQEEAKVIGLVRKDTDSDCILWQGGISCWGYGVVWLRGKQQRAHRVVYLHWVGEIPDGYVIDHLCGVKSCVNILHLEAVTPKENTARCAIAATTINANKTHCKNGHLFDSVVMNKGKPERRCKTCCREAQRRYRAKH